jgi:hypothetical protein
VSAGFVVEREECDFFDESEWWIHGVRVSPSRFIPPAVASIQRNPALFNCV